MTGPPHRPGLHPRHIMLALVSAVGALYIAGSFVEGMFWPALLYATLAFIAYLFAAMLVRLRDLRAWNRQMRLA